MARCLEEGCNDLKFRFLNDFRKHLVETHSVINASECRNLVFSSRRDFLDFLAQEESNTNSRFVRHRNARTNKAFVVTHYSCHRSGEYKPKGKGHRSLKTQGSNKIGFKCTASIVSREYPCGEVKVNYHYTHYGHDKLLGRLPLPKETRKAIADQLSKGINDQKILRDVRKSVYGKVDRSHLLTRKDIHNIRKCFGILKPEPIQQDFQPACMSQWVKKLKLSPEGDPVLFHKEQGQELEGFRKDDFVLIIMLPFQRKMIKKFGMDRICVDSTSITSDAFQLTTLLVVDQFEEGFPWAFCFSSRVDTSSMSIFFTQVKSVAGTVHAKYFMSDDAPLFYNVWRSVMGPVENRLLCSWHVDWDWQEHLNCITDKTKREEVYDVLKSCQYELDQKRFFSMFNELLEQLNDNPDTKTFHDYLNKYYSSSVEAWAYCHRKGARINANMHIENFHKQIKHIYAEEKVSKRIDLCVYNLISFVTDKEFERILKLHESQLSVKMAEMAQRHKEGLTLMGGSVEKLGADNWKVKGTPEEENFVQKTEHCCDPNSCLFICKQCSNICYFNYTCTCKDYTQQSNICKHIHAVVMMAKLYSAPMQCIIIQNPMTPLRKGAQKLKHILPKPNGNNNFQTQVFSEGTPNVPTTYQILAPVSQTIRTGNIPLQLQFVTADLLNGVALPNKQENVVESSKESTSGSKVKQKKNTKSKKTTKKKSTTKPKQVTMEKTFAPKLLRSKRIQAQATKQTVLISDSETDDDTIDPDYEAKTTSPDVEIITSDIPEKAKQKEALLKMLQELEGMITANDDFDAGVASGIMKNLNESKELVFKPNLEDKSQSSKKKATQKRAAERHKNSK